MKINLEKKNKNVLFSMVFSMLAFILSPFLQNKIWGKIGIIQEFISVFTKPHSPVLNGFFKVLPNHSTFNLPLAFTVLPPPLAPVNYYFKKKTHTDDNFLRTFLFRPSINLSLCT